MRKIIAAALLCAPSLASAQIAVPDYSNARAVEGSWTYAPTTGGSEAIFRNSQGQPQLFLTCTRASRQLSIAKPAAGAAPFLQVWASSASRNLPAAFNPATGRLTATLAATDPIFDALAMSRGRIAVGVAGQAAMVTPVWAEISRIVEDCRI